MLVAGALVMDARPIVRDSDILHGNWRFDGALTLITDLRRDFAAAGEGVRSSYRPLGLTDTEIDNALSFEYPAIDTIHVQAPFVRVMNRCVCEYHRHAVVAAPNSETTPCVGGRRWRIPVSIEPAPNGVVLHGSEPGGRNGAP